MNYEKKYKEALEVAKRKLCFDKAGMVDSFTPNDIYEMFPELKESEDERIRKELIGFLRNIPNSNYTCEEMALWLEKQGTRPRYNIGDVICDKSCTTLNKDAQPNMAIVDIQNGMYICDKGSFPVSQQDEYVLVSKKIDTKLNDNSVSNELRAASFAHAKKEILNHTFPNNEEFELAYMFEEGAKWDAAQKPAWSKEDEETLNSILTCIEHCQDEDIEARYNGNRNVNPKRYESMSDWLKSLRPQNKWKPSDAQIIALNDATTNGHLTNANERILKGLQEQLKKLK